MDKEKIFESTQNQATAAWIDHLNQLRLDRLILRLSHQDVFSEAALETIGEIKILVSNIIESNRGGVKGACGFIAEAAETGIVNARKLIEGGLPCYQWINDNGPADMLRDDIEIQQKFVQGDRRWGLTRVLSHMKEYPDFLKNGGKYQLPADFYSKVEKLLEMSPEEAAKLSNNSNGDGLTYSNWKWVQNFFADNDLTIDDFEPSVLDYANVQTGAIDKTLANEEQNIRAKDKSIRDKAYEESKPSLNEGLTATAVSAAVEGGVQFCLGVAKKIKSGKKLGDFTAEDWSEVGIDTAKGAGTGAIRGATVYAMTNFTATPAAVASACVTAAIGIAAQAQKLHDGTVSEDEFIANSEILCMDVSMSAIASIIGQVAIPVPVLGAIVGNTVGMFMYGLTKDHYSAEEQKLIKGYVADMEALNCKLDEHYRWFVELLQREFAKYSSMLELAFDSQVNIAFENSIAFADYIGVGTGKVLRSKKDIDNFFN